jgi:hypothetical protein
LFQRITGDGCGREISGNLPDVAGWPGSHSGSDECRGRISCNSMDLNCVFNEFENTQILIDKFFKYYF